MLTKNKYKTLEAPYQAKKKKGDSNMIGKRILVIFILLFAICSGFMIIAPETSLAEGPASRTPDFEKLNKEILQLMKEGDIPGLSLVIIRGDDPVYIKSFGLADKDAEKPVTPDTLFEIASCSKAFTALAAVQLADKGLINLDDPLSKYFPDFTAQFEGKLYPITLRQLLHHTGGIPWNAIQKIQRGAQDDSLKLLVDKISGIELEWIPGSKFKYSTVNYDLIGAVMEKVTGMSFESYLVENVFKPLDMKDTIVGVDQSNPPAKMSHGHKVGFFKARRFVAPVYRSNNPAAYVATNANDLARWLKFQLGMVDSPLFKFAEITQQPDLSVEPTEDSFSSYAMGWEVNPYGIWGINHTGLNPNFTSYMRFNPKEKTAVGILSNSNSVFLGYLGHKIYLKLYGRDISSEVMPSDGLDKASSVIALMAFMSILAVFLFFVSIVLDVIKGKRKYEAFSMKKLNKMLGILLFYLPFLVGIYILPTAIADSSWDMALVWSPSSFQWSIFLILGAMASSYLAFIVSSIFPQQNKYWRNMPFILVLSLLTGGANAVVIFLITSSLYIRNNVWYVLYYFAMVLVLYIGGRKIVQTKLIQVTMDIVYDLRMQLIGKVFFTTYQKFERIDQGRVLATLSNDTGQIGGSAGLFVNLISSIITTIAVFIYLATIAFWATALTILVIILIAGLYYVVGQKANAYLEAARDTQNVYMGLLNGMVAGFKELSLHIKKRLHYKGDLEESCDQFREKSVGANIKLINAFLIGESLLIVILGAVGFGVPHVFPEIKNITLMSFIIALLYLIGPINGILGSIPGILGIRIAWNRVQGFITDVPANMNEEDVLAPLQVEKNDVISLDTANLIFQYKKDTTDSPAGSRVVAAPEMAQLPADFDLDSFQDNKSDAVAAVDKQQNGRKEEVENMFSVGPVDVQAGKGEIIFIVGGNGSGKTTLAKLLTGLYESDEGFIKVNGKTIPNYQLGEYFSVVFGDFHLFNKIYEVDLSTPEAMARAQKILVLLEMEKKVEIVDGKFSTVNLSGGQRKRLALMQCFLEDSPVYLFDEVAADQDPQFRKFFYRKLLKQMKDDGKIVIAITHDDHYFDAADKVIKMDMGKIDYVADGEKYNVTS